MAKEKEQVAQVIVAPKSGVVVNRMNHPVTVNNNGNEMVIAPRGRRQVEDIKKVSGLPKEGVKILETINE
jgi:hypothetical protein